MFLVDVFGAGTTLGAFSVIFATMPMCLQLFRTKKVRSMPFLFFLIGDIRWVIYLHYGSLLDNQLILLMGSFGTFIFTTYIVMYTYYSKTMFKPALSLLLTWMFFMVFYQFLYNIWENTAERHEGMGFLLVLLSFLLFTIPLLDVLQVLKTSNTKCVHPIIMYPTGLWSICWCVYGVMHNSPYVYGPTIPGILVFLAHIYLLKRYRKDSKRHKGIVVFYLNKKRMKEKKESCSSLDSSLNTATLHSSGTKGRKAE